MEFKLLAHFPIQVFARILMKNSQCRVALLSPTPGAPRGAPALTMGELIYARRGAQTSSVEKKWQPPLFQLYSLHVKDSFMTPNRI